MSAQRFWRGFGWGVVATVVMSALMILSIVTGVSPMPRPIPVAIFGRLTGGGLPQPLIIVLAVGAHLAYGGFWAGVLASRARRVSLAGGVALGVFLWLLMQLFVLPYLGWGLFGVAQTPKIAVATLVLHLVYGLTLGALGGRIETPQAATDAADIASVQH